MVKRSQGGSERTRLRAVFLARRNVPCVAPKATLSPPPRCVNGRWGARKDDAEMASQRDTYLK